MKGKKRIRLLWLLIALIYSMAITANAYTTLPSTSLSINVGSEEYLEVPSVSTGYVDNAIWACSSPYIQFIEKDEIGATIKVLGRFQGTAVVELMFTQKYITSDGHVRANSYYKEFHITCKDGGSSGDGVTIIMPEEITLKFGETKTFQAVKGQLYSGCYFAESDGSGIIMMEQNFVTGIVTITGIKEGHCTCTINTAGGASRVCKITVLPPEAPVNKGRTVNKAAEEMHDLALYASRNYSGVEEISVDSPTSEVEYYDLNGIKVVKPEKGIYIRIQNGKTTTVNIE